MSIPELLSTKEAATLLGLAEVTLRKQRIEGERLNRLPLIPWVKLSPRCVKYRRSDLIQFLQSLETKGVTRAED